MSLTTDLERKYGQGEVERILVKASPKNWTDDNYKLIGKNHLMETQVAQVVIDIFKACEKIRTNWIRLTEINQSAGTAILQSYRKIATLLKETK